MPEPSKPPGTSTARGDRARQRSNRYPGRDDRATQPHEEWTEVGLRTFIVPRRKRDPKQDEPRHRGANPGQLATQERDAPAFPHRKGKNADAARRSSLNEG